MKQILAVAISVLLLSTHTAAIADSPTYIEETNAVSVNAGNYSTVLIKNNANGEVVYINQATAGGTLSNTIPFLIMDNAVDGEYLMILGGGENNAYTTRLFDIGEVTAEDKMMAYLGYEDGTQPYTVNAAFSLEAVNLSKYNIIKVQIGQKAGGLYLNDILGVYNGEVNFGLQLNNIPEEYADEISVYLSNGTLSSNKMDWGS
ncbi:MAG: hypothetical protein IJH37_00485 [Clostridia bacterium]|nr:hypothetical protein [Clostridia bacterium]